MAQRKLTKVSGTSLYYDKGSNIGRGGFSIVFRGFLESDVYEALAVKRIQICDISEEANINREAELMLKASKDHCNILRYICTEMDTNFWYHCISTLYIVVHLTFPLLLNTVGIL